MTGIRSLFLTQLPSDVKPQAVDDLFRPCPGYIIGSARTMPSKRSSSELVGFADFDSPRAAESALDRFNGFKFRRGDRGIEIELARQNSRNPLNAVEPVVLVPPGGSRPMASMPMPSRGGMGPGPAGLNRRDEYEYDEPMGGRRDGRDREVHDGRRGDLIDMDVQSRKRRRDDDDGLRRYDEDDRRGGMRAHTAAPVAGRPLPRPGGFESHPSTGANGHWGIDERLPRDVIAPMPIPIRDRHGPLPFDHIYHSFGQSGGHLIHVDDIPEDCTERELAHLFRPYPGFVALRVDWKANVPGVPGRGLIGMVEFDTREQADTAVCNLQDYRLAKGDKIGLKLMHARPLRERSMSRDRRPLPITSLQMIDRDVVRAR